MVMFGLCGVFSCVKKKNSVDSDGVWVGLYKGFGYDSNVSMFKKTRLHVLLLSDQPLSQLSNILCTVLPA